MIQAVEFLKKRHRNDKIESFRKDYVQTLQQNISDNVLRLGYLMTVAKK